MWSIGFNTMCNVLLCRRRYFVFSSEGCEDRSFEFACKAFGFAFVWGLIVWFLYVNSWSLGMLGCCLYTLYLVCSEIRRVVRVGFSFSLAYLQQVRLAGFLKLHVMLGIYYSS